MGSLETQANLFVTGLERQARNGHREIMVWLTGLSASGKTTLSQVLERELFNESIQVCGLDGDNIRRGINRGLSYSKEDRHENVCRLAEIGKLFLDAGFVAIISAISPYRMGREYAQNLVGAHRFLEVYVKCPLAECEKRDPKGLYHKARIGDVIDFTGITSPYEEPLAPDIVVETNTMSVHTCVYRIKSRIMDRISLSTEE